MLVARRGVGRSAAEPRDRRRDAQRVGRADRLAQLGDGALDDVPGQRERRRAQPVDACDLLLEAERGQLGVLVGHRAGHREHEAAAELSGQERPGSELGERAHRRRDEQPRALVGGLRVGAQGGGRGGHGEQVPAVRGERHDDRPLAPGARERELAPAVRELRREQRPELAGALPRGAGPAGVAQRGGQVVHAGEPTWKESR